jgi:type 1 fimbria pilin
MKNIKKMMTALTLTLVLFGSATFANAGIIITGNATEPQPCTVDTNIAKWGVILTDLTGIIITGNATGIIITGNAKDLPVDCGILITG